MEGRMVMSDGRGVLAQRPPVTAVPVGFRYVAIDEPGGEAAYVSDGEVWVRDDEAEMWTLKYGEDVTQGERIRRPRKIGEQHTQLGPFVQVQPGVEITEFCQVIEVRKYDGVGLIACRAVRGDGEQIPIYLHPYELVQVAADVPGMTS